MHGKIADLGVLLNVVSLDEHVPEVDQCNRTTKEHMMANYNILPFTHFPPLFIIKIVHHSSRNSVYTQSQPKIIIGHQLDFNAHCKIDFRECVQTQEEHDNMQSCTIGVIAICPTGSSKSG